MRLRISYFVVLKAVLSKTTLNVTWNFIHAVSDSRIYHGLHRRGWSTFHHEQILHWIISSFRVIILFYLAFNHRHFPPSSEYKKLTEIWNFSDAKLAEVFKFGEDVVKLAYFTHFLHCDQFRSHQTRWTKTVYSTEKRFQIAIWWNIQIMSFM